MQCFLVRTVSIEFLFSCSLFSFYSVAIRFLFCLYELQREWKKGGEIETAREGYKVSTLRTLKKIQEIWEHKKKSIAVHITCTRGVSFLCICKGKQT